MNAQLAKVFGWAQFAANTLPQLLSNGFPHGVLGWLGFLGSLAGAVGIHAASSTDGAK